LKFTKEYNIIDTLACEAEESCCDVQPFAGHFMWRAEEFKHLFVQAGMPSWGQVLEVGCGNAFNAALIARFAEKVYATDLQRMDQSTESPGIEKAGCLLKKLSINNCSLISSDAQQLPFKDNLFDVVYSNYTLEHVHNKSLAVREMIRVVKPGGSIFATVPNFVERLTYIPLYYAYVLRRSFYHIGKRCRGFSQKKTPQKDMQNGIVSIMDPRIAWKGNPNFPFPDIHGQYRSFRHELVSSSFPTWSGLFDKKQVRIKKIFTTISIPWHLISLIHPKLPLWVYKKSHIVQRKLGAVPVLNLLGHNLVLQYVKES